VEWRNLTADAGVSYFFRDAQTVVSAHYSVSHDNRKIVSDGQMLILAVA
jgi:N-acetyl-anhydromuramyl-L-alanine amidase AmpD